MMQKLLQEPWVQSSLKLDMTVDRGIVYAILKLHPIKISNSWTIWKVTYKTNNTKSLKHIHLKITGYCINKRFIGSNVCFSSQKSRKPFFKLLKLRFINLKNMNWKYFDKNTWKHNHQHNAIAYQYNLHLQIWLQKPQIHDTFFWIITQPCWKNCKTTDLRRSNTVAWNMCSISKN